MSRYLGPKRKLSLRLGLLYGFHTFFDESLKNKNLKKKKFIIFSESLKTLIKKQKIRFLYGLTNTQLEKKLRNNKKTLFNILESRLDCTLFRLGFTNSIASARQLVLHKYITVNKKVINFPGYLCKKNDIISFKKTNFLQSKLDKKFEKFQKKKFLLLHFSKIFESSNSKLLNYFPNNFKQDVKEKNNPVYSASPHLKIVLNMRYSQEARPWTLTPLW